MRISVLTIGAIASILSLNAYASSVVTSQTYVDNQDALKVNIAQGVGTNNANVGKTLVVNSQGNLELGAPAAGNYVEDSITDGVTNKAPSENAVHDALANKQDTIDADTMEFSFYGDNFEVPTTVVSYDTTNGIVGDQYGIASYDIVDTLGEGDGLWVFGDSAEVLSTSVTDKMIPTARVVANDINSIWNDLNNYKQNKIRESGISMYSGVPYREDSGISSTDHWLNIQTKGTGLVTRTPYANAVGERKIFEASDVSNYHAGTLTQIQKDIQDISIPTVGAMMTMISNNTPTLPTGTANTVVMYNNSGAIGGSRAIYDGSATYNATNDASKLVTGSGVSKMKECTRWFDNAEHTDANCLLWRLP